jgi:hypothetical protein
MAEPPERQPTDTAQIPHWMTRYNPPGLSELVYRGGRYQRALSQMLALLPAQSSRDGDQKTSKSPLALLNTEAQNDWTLALLRSWAAVTEVLGFYQERIVNEGYLHTATERRSVLELARMIGYELRPGVAASADLVFTVLTTKEEPSRQVLIPAGTAVQSVPAPGELSQTFETSAEFAARSEWNALKPTLVQAVCWPPYPVEAATSARLIGADTGVGVDDTILIIGDTPEQDGSERPWLLARLKTVRPFPEQGYTRVTWEGPPFFLEVRLSVTRGPSSCGPRLSSSDTHRRMCFLRARSIRPVSPRPVGRRSRPACPRRLSVRSSATTKASFSPVPGRVCSGPTILGRTGNRCGLA